jgi:hypothetical protein
MKQAAPIGPFRISSTGIREIASRVAVVALRSEATSSTQADESCAPARHKPFVNFGPLDWGNSSGQVRVMRLRNPIHLQAQAAGASKREQFTFLSP